MAAVKSTRCHELTLPIPRKAKQIKRKARPNATRSPGAPGKVVASQMPRQVRNLTHQFVLRNIHGNLTSTGGGVITDVVTDDPTTTGRWSSVVNLFDSYRVLELQIQYFPYYVGSVDTGSAVNFPPLFVVYDPDTTTAVTSVTNALAYDDVKAMDTTKMWTLSVKVPRIGSTGTGTVKVSEGGYIDSASALPITSFSWYGDNFTGTTTFGRMIKTVVVECKYRI